MGRGVGGAVGGDVSFDHSLDMKEGTNLIDTGPGKILSRLKYVYGNTFLSYLCLTYFGLKGVSYALTTAAMLPFFQKIGVAGNGYQLATVVAGIPWSMKGFVGVLSDCFPIGYYHKRGYLLLSAFIGCVAFGALVCIPLKSSGPNQVWFVAMLFCAANVMHSTFDLLCEGKYSEIMRVRRAGPEVLTLVWTCVQSGALLAALITGLFVDKWGPQPLIGVCLPFSFLAIWRTAAGDIPEQRARSWKSLRLKVWSQPELFSLAAGMAFGGLILGISAATLGSVGRAVTAFTVSGSLVIASFKCLPTTLAKGNLYMFLMSFAYMDLTGPLSYFYTGSSSCVVDAPHFSYSYYLAISNVVGAIGSMLGSLLFQGMQDWTFRSAFYVTTFLQVFASFFDLMIIYRWNIVLHISDKAMYLFGDAACQNMAAMMAIMPMAMLTARLCPRGAEATVFAILAGFQNFGGAVGSIVGVMITEMVDVVANPDGPCNFENLGNLVVIAHILTPLACLPLTYFLVPSVRMDDETAFETAPPPSFCSPPASPAPSRCSSAPSSPRSCPDSPPLMAADPLDFGDSLLRVTSYHLLEDVDEDAGGGIRVFH